MESNLEYNSSTTPSSLDENDFNTLKYCKICYAGRNHNDITNNLLKISNINNLEMLGGFNLFGGLPNPNRFQYIEVCYSSGYGYLFKGGRGNIDHISIVLIKKLHLKLLILV